MAKITPLSDHDHLTEPPAPMLGLTDIVQYGDLLHSFPRLLASGSVAMTTGVVHASGLFATGPGTATKLRIATAADALSGTGSYRLGLYTGPNPAALTPKATLAALAAVAGTFYELTLPAALSWSAYEFVALLALPTGWTTPPRLRSVVGGGPSSAVLNSGNRYCAVSASGQSALPTGTISLNSYSGSGSPHWWALAA